VDSAHEEEACESGGRKRPGLARAWRGALRPVKEEACESGGRKRPEKEEACESVARLCFSPTSAGEGLGAQGRLV
jgi:hypothetical protein